MHRLIGKKVLVTQRGEEEGEGYLMWCVGFWEGFIALALEMRGDPTLYVNLENVAAVAVYDDQGREGRLLVFPRPFRTVPPEDVQ